MTPDRLNLDPIEVVNLRPLANQEIEVLLHVSQRDYNRLIRDRGARYSIPGTAQHHDGPKVPQAVGQGSADSRCWRRGEDGDICLLPEGHTQEEWEMNLVSDVIDGKQIPAVETL